MAWCGGLRADHGQKHDPGDEISFRRDLTNEGPLQKHYFGRLIAPLFFTGSSFAIWTSLSWRSKNEVDDCVAYGRQAWLRWRSVDFFFFRPACARRRCWRKA